MQKIYSTQPHYVRCLKPNDELIPDHFDPSTIADQLRYAGVIEAVRISRVGYPQRYTHARFLARYGTLGQQALKQAPSLPPRRETVAVLVEAIAVQMNQPESGKEQADGANMDLMSIGIQVGKTKVFLRRKAYEALEQLRSQYLTNCAIKIQSLARCYILKKEYSMSRKAIIRLQRYIRSAIIHKVVHEKRQNYNAIRIQTAYRRAVTRRLFVSMKFCSQWLQKRHRGNVGRLRYISLNRERKAKVLQKFWRIYSTSKQLQQKNSASLVIQCAWRCTQSRKQLRHLRTAAKNLNNITLERDKLREEKMELQRALTDALYKKSMAEKNVKDLQNQRGELLYQIRQLEETCTLIDKENNVLKFKVEKLRHELKLSKMSLQKNQVQHQNTEEKLTDALNRANVAENKVKYLKAQRKKIMSKIQELGKDSYASREKEELQTDEIQTLRSNYNHLFTSSLDLNLYSK